MEKVTIFKNAHLSPHFTLGEMCKSSHKEVYNIPSHVAIENLKRLCIWLEALRLRYNQRYVLGNGERSVSPPELGDCILMEQSSVRGGLKEGICSAPSEPIIINSAYRSPALNKLVGGSPTSNHLTGCAVDIRVSGIEQAKRYKAILMEYADETKQDYDELLIERNKSGNYWLHFAVRPKDNRRKTKFLKT